MKLKNGEIWRAYPKLVELVYRSRNYARELTQSTDYVPSINDNLQDTFYLLEDNLYQHRLDINEDDFLLLHQFKSNLRTFMGIYKIVQDITKKTKFNAEHIKELYIELDLLYDNIAKQLKQTISEYTNQ